MHASDAVLEIAQAVVSGSALNVQVGSVSLGRSADKIVKQGNVQYTVNGNRLFNVNGGNQGAQVKVDTQLGEKCRRVTEELKELSLILSRRTADNTVALPTGQPGPVNFNVQSKDAEGFAFFTVADGNALFHNSKVQQIEIKNEQVKASVIVINVGGKSVTFDNGNIVGSLTQLDTRSRVLFNFYEAEQIVLERNFMGALLAPLAVVRTNANIDGATAVKSLTTTSELHKPQLVFPQCGHGSATEPPSECENSSASDGVGSCAFSDA